MRRTKSAGTVVHLRARREEAQRQLHPEELRGGQAHGELTHGEPEEVPALYGVALLRIALELKRPGADSLEEVVRRVTARMRLEEGPFRTFLERQGGLQDVASGRRG